MANNVLLAMMQAVRLAVSMQSGMNEYAERDYTEDVQKALEASNATSYSYVNEEERENDLDQYGFAFTASEEQAEEEGLTGGGDGNEPEHKSGLDDLFDQMEDSAHDTAGDIDEQDWSNMTDAEKASELLLRANALVDNYGDILGSDDITSDSLDDFVNNLRDTVNNSDNDEFRDDANDFLRNYDAANNFEQDSQDQNTPAQDPAQGDFVGSDGSSPVEAYDEQRIEFWTIIASLGLAAVAVVTVPSVIKAANRGLSLRNNGTRYLIGQSSLKEAKKLSKLNKKVKKAQDKLSKKPTSVRLRKKLEKVVSKRNNYAKSCYIASSTKKANFEYLEKYAKKALKSARYGNKEYTNKENLTSSNYKNLMKAVRMYAKAQQESSSNKKNKLMDKAAKIAKDITLADGSLYYGANVMKLGKDTYPIFPQRYISSGLIENLDKDTQNYFNEIYKLYPTMEKATYSGEISYELNGETKSLKYSFDNVAAADAIKAALLVGIDTKVEGITIKETVQTPRRSETQTTEYTGEDWINLQSAMATAYDRSRRLINEVAERKIFDVEVEQAQTPAPAQVVAQAQVVTQTQTAAPVQEKGRTQTASQIFETQPAGQPAEQAAAPAERQQTPEERTNSELTRYFHQDRNDGMNL